MKIAIASILVCIALCGSAHRDGRRPHGPGRRGPVTPQELSQIISSGLRHLDEELRKREPIPIPKLNSTIVQTDSVNLTVDWIGGKQLLGKTVLQTVSVKRTDSSLKLALEVEQEGNVIDSTAAINGTINGTDIELSAPIKILTESVSIKVSLEAVLGEKSVNVTDLDIETSASAANVTLIGTELDQDVVESIQQAVADEMAQSIAEAQKIVEENKEKTIAVLNEEVAGKSLEEIVDKLVKEHHRGHHGHHGRLQKHFQQLLSL